MKVGDHKIFTRGGREAEVIVTDVHTPDVPMVLCVCGGQCAAAADELRPLPRVRVDMSGRVVLNVVEDSQ